MEKTLKHSGGAAFEAAGLVYAFAVTNGMARKLTTHSVSARDEAADYLWIHVNLSTEPGRQWLLKQSSLPPQLGTTFLDHNLEHGARAVGSGCLLALVDRRQGFDDDSVELGELRIWIEPTRVITGRWHPLSATDQMRFRCDVGEAPHTTAGFVQDLFETIVNDMESISHRARLSLDRLEDEILDDEIEGVAGRLGVIRRGSIQMRRRVQPLRHLVARLRDVLPAWVMAEDRQDFGALIVRLDRHLVELHEIQEQCRLLADESQARYNERNSRNIYIISILTAVMMPLNIITGIFGMNVAGLPGIDDPGGFGWVMVSMALTAVAVVAIFKMKRWF